jgi:FixJ family two-component response regulator
MGKPLLAIIDDNEAVRDSVRVLAELHGFETCLAQDAAELAERIGFDRPDAIIMDVVMPKRDGIELLRDLAAEGFTKPIVIMSGSALVHLDTATQLARAMGLNVAATLAKPAPVARLEGILDDLMVTALAGAAGALQPLLPTFAAA